jgi:radical SAM-linked protein
MEGSFEIRDSRLEIPAGEPTRAASTLVVRFRIGRALRFLSHAETSRVFQRACARAEIPVKYSAGFNPHPKLSLPLPRSVGVESDDELLVIRLADEPRDTDETYEARIREALQERLPAGIEVTGVERVESGSFHARTVDYLFCLRADRAADLADRLRQRGQVVLAGESWIVERKLPGDRKARRIDVRPFLEAIQPVEGGAVVRCNVTAAGSIRIDEILQLLELEMEDLAAPIRRTAVEWTSTKSPMEKQQGGVEAPI